MHLCFSSVFYFLHLFFCASESNYMMERSKESERATMRRPGDILLIIGCNDESDEMLSSWKEKEYNAIARVYTFSNNLW